MSEAIEEEIHEIATKNFLISKNIPYKKLDESKISLNIWLRHEKQNSFNECSRRTNLVTRRSWRF